MLWLPKVTAHRSYSCHGVDCPHCMPALLLLHDQHAAAMHRTRLVTSFRHELGPHDGLCLGTSFGHELGPDQRTPLLSCFSLLECPRTACVCCSPTAHICSRQRWARLMAWLCCAGIAPQPCPPHWMLHNRGPIHWLHHVPARHRCHRYRSG